ncbi:hypothetical protein BD311DRAFT_775780 [Dichomitus squalens]|uniref:DUF6535 domain-containing protein n=1 Tax=Dichomitus squalens TaxID=114155 RepID=A0A4Q9MV75_9APHY|nr:hypothetical protein BD311DRAFT_775780 [Dichomitus squalens]
MSAGYSAETEHIPGARLRTNQIPTTCPFDEDEISRAWERCSDTVQQHCDQMVSRWKEGIDMHLVFNGLFSAVLTAFNVQSFTINGTSISSTAATFVSPSFSAPVSAIWINALWFASLIGTLSASSVAIMVKQWLHQYDLGLSGNSHEIARLRQYRYESLVKWHVVEIVAFLPIIPQVSLLLFLAGLLILLWTLHIVIAGLATGLIGVLVLFTVATTILPAFKADCFYQSQLALGVFLSLQALREVFRKPRFGPNVFRNWHAREKSEIQTKRSDLDRRLATTAYAISLDDHILNEVVIPCMWDLPSERLSPLLDDVYRTSNRWEPLVPCALHFILLVARDPGTNTSTVTKLLSSKWWPRIEPTSDLGALFLKTMATLVSRGVEAEAAFYRVCRTLSYSALDGGTRLRQEVIEHLVSILPNPKSGRQFAALIRRKDPEGLPLIHSYLLTMPMLVRYLARLVVDSPHETERVQLHIDAMFHTLQAFLMHIAWTQDLSNLSTALWALRRTRHIAQITYQDVLSNINFVVSGKVFQMHFKRRLDRFTTANLGSKDASELATMLQDDIDVLAKLFQIDPFHLTGRGRLQNTNDSAMQLPKTPPRYTPQRFVSSQHTSEKFVVTSRQASDDGEFSFRVSPDFKMISHL